ncbi:hypothetical protein BG006_008601 [Podila minutissima]|uniref:F-box protein n=1 Tax=Podila minutissima TaxID=64525 RepID=A0A9P5SJU8_9FUNG|nr:hypothetical protein BG006_008601 [Podila minutissima]
MSSYVCDTDTVLKLSKPPGLGDQGLRSIKIPTLVHTKALITIFEFWPNLEHLHLHEITNDDERAKHYGPNSDDTVQGKVRSVKLESPKVFLSRKIHFPGLESISCRLVSDPAVLRQMLQRFPVLKSATLGELDGGTPVWNSPSFKGDKNEVFPLKFLKIHWCLRLGMSLSGIIEQCPCLVEIKWSAMDLLTNCSRLTELVCQELRIHVDDILANEPWTCVGLRKLRCEIVGIPRLDTTMEIEAFKSRTFQPEPPALVSAIRQYTGGSTRRGQPHGNYLTMRTFNHLP